MVRAVHGVCVLNHLTDGALGDEVTGGFLVSVVDANNRIEAEAHIGTGDIDTGEGRMVF